MIHYLYKLYYKHLLGSEYDSRIENASLMFYAISDFTMGGRGHNITIDGQQIRARHTRVRIAQFENPLVVKYIRPV